MDFRGRQGHISGLRPPTPPTGRRKNDIRLPASTVCAGATMPLARHRSDDGNPAGAGAIGRGDGNARRRPLHRRERSSAASRPRSRYAFTGASAADWTLDRAPEWCDKALAEFCRVHPTRRCSPQPNTRRRTRIPCASSPNRGDATPPRSGRRPPPRSGALQGGRTSRPCRWSGCGTAHHAVRLSQRRWAPYHHRHQVVL